MTLPISSSESGIRKNRRVPNRALFLLNGKRFLWLPVLNTILLFFSVPFLMLMEGPRQVASYLETARQMEAAGMAPPVSEWFYHCTFRNPVVVFLMLAVGLVWAAVLFHYLNENKTVAFFHSLPFGRRSLFLNFCLTAAAGILMPLVLVGLICLLLLFYQQFSLLYTAGQVLWWILCSFLWIMSFFATGVCMGMITGQALVQPVFALILQVLPLGLYTLVSYLLQKLIYGFPAYSDALLDYLRYLPLIQMFEGEAPKGTYLLLLLVFSLVFLGLGWLLYRRRPLERTGDIIVFPVLRPIFKYGVTFCVSLCGGLLITEIMGAYLPLWPFLLWALIGYAIAEMLLQKSVRILHAWKGLAVYCVVFLVAIAGLRVDLFGYERRLPQAEQVAYALVNRQERGIQAELEALDAMAAAGIRVPPQLMETFYLEGLYREPEDIATVIQLQERLIRDKERQRDKNRYNDIVYVMKDGSIMRRQYANLYAEENLDLIKKLEEAPESRRWQHGILAALPEDVDWMTVSDTAFQTKESPLLSPEQIAGLLAAYQKDLQEETYEEMEGQKQELYSINLHYNMPKLDWEVLQKLSPEVFNENLLRDMSRWYGSLDQVESSGNRYNQRMEILPVYGYFHHTLAWLEENGLAKALLPDPESIGSVYLYKGYNYWGTAEEYAYWIQSYQGDSEDWQQDYYETYGISDGPAAAVYETMSFQEYLTLDPEAPSFLDSLELVEITEPALIQRILQEGGYDPYFLPLGEEERAKECWHIDFLSSSGDPVFTGYYYGGLPEFLQAEVTGR